MRVKIPQPKKEKKTDDDVDNHHETPQNRKLKIKSLYFKNGFWSVFNVN